MKIAISGTYSVGKTLTTMAVAHLFGLPRSAAMTMRELLPISIPGKTLEECTASEIIMLIMRRNQERAVNEALIGKSFVSDGSSLHEWCYGTVRVTVGINPTEMQTLDQVQKNTEIAFYKDVLEKMGVAAKQHAVSSYDKFIHLPIEFPLVKDGHRPVNEKFRSLAENLLLDTLKELNIPCHIVGGSIPDRLSKIVEILGIKPVMTIDNAINNAQSDYAKIDMSDELSRQKIITA